MLIHLRDVKPWQRCGSMSLHLPKKIAEGMLGVTTDTEMALFYDTEKNGFLYRRKSPKRKFQKICLVKVRGSGRKAELTPRDDLEG